MQRGGEEMLDDLDLAWEEQQEPRRRRGTAQSRQARQRRKKEKKRRRRSWGALFISFLLLLALGGGVYWGVGKLQDYFGAPDYVGNPQKVPVNVVVNPGDTATEIGNELFDKKVVKSAKAFILAADAEPRSQNIQPGTYRLYEQTQASVALAMLLDPAKNMLVDKVTIPEGKSVKETLVLLSKATEVPLAEFEAAAKDLKAFDIPDFWWTRDGKDGRKAIKSLEGFLFPDTYAFSPDATATDMLNTMVKRFFQVAEEVKLVDTAEQKGVTPFEALTVASLVEKEAGVPEDMGKVARVVYNRLKPEWESVDCGCLGFDSTTNYWRVLNGLPVKPSSQMTTAELQDPRNPYNTAVKPGLPPGPIANPGKAALQAAISPTPGPWLYFVLIDKQGRSAFAVTYADHQRNIAKAKEAGVG
ncbi:MAG TPA: endolytic transglycosylase MltG [Micromonosporaceae bacterium]